MKEWETLVRMIESYVRDDKNGRLFQSWLKPTRSQTLDILIRDRAWEILAQVRRTI
jgi:hypothetical protein